MSNTIIKLFAKYHDILSTHHHHHHDSRGPRLPPTTSTTYSPAFVICRPVALEQRTGKFLNESSHNKVASPIIVFRERKTNLTDAKRQATVKAENVSHGEVWNG